MWKKGTGLAKAAIILTFLGLQLKIDFFFLFEYA